MFAPIIIFLQIRKLSQKPGGVQRAQICLKLVSTKLDPSSPFPNIICFLKTNGAEILESSLETRRGTANPSPIVSLAQLTLPPAWTKSLTGAEKGQHKTVTHHVPLRCGTAARWEGENTGS